MGSITEPDLIRRSGFNDDDVIFDHELWSWTQSSGNTLVGIYPQREIRNIKMFQGWDIPDYHSKLRQGILLPHTPWQRTSVLGSSTGLYDVWTNGGTSHWWCPGVWTSYPEWLLTIEELRGYAPTSYDKFVNEAAAKIYSSGYDALTAIAELTEVRHLFVESATKLLKLKIPKNVRQMSCEWLSARYGWRTLIFDIKNLNEAISNFDEKRSRYSERCGAKSTTTIIAEHTYEKTHFYLNHVVKDEVTTYIRGSVAAEIVVPKFQFNPLQTAWELIPFSFVVDWFLSIGKSLAALSFLAYQTSYTASKGFKVEVERTFDVRIGDTKSTFTSGTYWQTGKVFGEYEIRTPCVVSLTPHFTLKLNPYKIIDLVGLVLQRIH